MKIVELAKQFSYVPKAIAEISAEIGYVKIELQSLRRKLEEVYRLPCYVRAEGIVVENQAVSPVTLVSDISYLGPGESEDFVIRSHVPTMIKSIQVCGQEDTFVSSLLVGHRCIVPSDFDVFNGTIQVEQEITIGQLIRGTIKRLNKS